MQFIQANDNAFNAYNILYYPLFGSSEQSLFPMEDFQSAPEPNEQDYMLALAVQEDLSKSPYTLSARALTILARTFSALRRIGSDGLAKATLNPAADIRRMCPDEPMGEPMYPDFPSQVLDIEENIYRMHQIRHYMSTYGIEVLASLLGMDVTVSEGWLPDAEKTEKLCDDKEIISKHVVEVAITDEYMAKIVEDSLARPTRMPNSACALAVDLFQAGLVTDLSNIKFHENMMDIIASASQGSSSDLAAVLESAAQHPGDIIKAILNAAGHDGSNHIKTRQKKGFCQALERFEARDIASNIADLARRGQKAINMLSPARFAGSNLACAIDLVESGKVKSFNSTLESAWSELLATNIEKPTEASVDALLSLYKKRPGLLLRSIGRMYDAKVPPEKILDALLEVSDSLSLATLVRFMTIMSAEDNSISLGLFRSRHDQDDERRREANAVRNPMLAAIVAPVLAKRLGDLDTPIASKKVFVDTAGFSLVGSVVMPSEETLTSGAYPPAGMAYDIPADKTVRFFTFWDDRTTRVDVDLHFDCIDKDGERHHVGWCSDFRSSGMVMSGDITHSENAAEYLDVDMPEALRCGIDTILQHQHVYTGEQWKEIAKCFSGALVVGDKEPDVKLYNSSNILFHDDMNGSGNKMAYALINVPEHYVRILRGATMPFRKTAFTLDDYIGLLMEAQGARLVADIEEADVILSVGRAAADEIAGIPVVSLIDEKFFIR